MKQILTLFLTTFLAFTLQAKLTDTAPQADLDKYSWNLTDIYSDWDAWNKDLESFKSQIPKYNEYKGTLNESPEQLLKLLQFNEEVSKLVSRIYFYVSSNQDIDGKNPMYVTKMQEFQNIYIDLSRNTAWILPELMTIPREKIDKWIAGNKDLSVYAHDFDQLYRQQEHILDEQTQKIISYFSQALSASSQIYGTLTKADMEFNRVTLSTGEEVVTSPANTSKVFTTNPNQTDRKITLEAREEVYAKNKNTYAEILMGVFQNRWANAQLQGYETNLDAVLSPNNISKDVFMNLIDVAGNNTESLLKYRELRKKALGLDKYYYSDEAFEISDYMKSYKWEEAVDMVKECLKPMGKEYNELLATALQGGWIDVFEKPGKQPGAYSGSTYGVHPYILMNWNESRDNVYTLAHELGHSLHTMLSNTYQPYVYSGYSPMVAETASTFNENMLLDYMVKNAKNPNEKISLLVQAIDNISGTFYRQAQFAEFEYALYSAIEKNQPLNADIIASIYVDIDKKYNGDIFERSENFGYAWPRVHHFFNYYYYVYNYAVSFSCSSSLFDKIANAKDKDEAAKAQEMYLNLLKSGGSDYPVELLKKAGVDLNTKEPFLSVVKRMDNLVNQLEVALKEAGKI
ncbi:MAG TPA: oligoendopeptidase F [Tenuifilaceae bacterium]|nr:oligoendopeptidase F [Tenuifilaceae bacterium]HPE18787.1 oligoendopeptidase F [Tenuifilaceae bacterium]HRX69216.1 oligoendopeptidase F [Tenuifilaceae bacterium]